MYMLAMYYHSIYAGTVTDPQKVLTAFLNDNNTMAPVSITENNTRVFITYKTSEYLYAYTLPLEYKKYIQEKLKQ